MSADPYRLTTLAACAVALGAGVGAIGVAMAEAPRLLAHGQIEVVDGDTIRLDGERWRLTGYDAPDAGARARCDAERLLAPAATLALRRMIAAASLLVLDPAAARDVYGRPLGRLTIDGEPAAARMDALGLAYRARLCPVTP